MHNVPECECSGAGHCPVYNTRMSQKAYQLCKHDPVWRADNRKFWGVVNNPQFSQSLKDSGYYDSDKDITKVIKQQAKDEQDLLEKEEQQHVIYI